jgi:hypothetical protein
MYRSCLECRRIEDLAKKGKAIVRGQVVIFQKVHWTEYHDPRTTMWSAILRVETHQRIGKVGSSHAQALEEMPCQRRTGKNTTLLEVAVLTRAASTRVCAVGMGTP